MIPTAIAIDHVAYNVPDIEQAVAFFTTVLGCDVLDRLGPRPFGAVPDSSVVAVMLRYTASVTIELLEFHLPGQQSARPALTDTAGYHLAFSVTDLDAAIAYLATQPGVQVGTPSQLPNGRRRVFFTTPWGMPMQLITPAGHRVFGRPPPFQVMVSTEYNKWA